MVEQAQGMLSVSIHMDIQVLCKYPNIIVGPALQGPRNHYTWGGNRNMVILHHSRLHIHMLTWIWTMYNIHTMYNMACTMCSYSNTTEEWLGIAHTQATFKGPNCSLGMRIGLQYRCTCTHNCCLVPRPYSRQKQKEKCQKLYVSGLQLALFPGSCMGHGSLGMRLVNSLFRFCSKHHNVDNPIQCLYASEIRYVYWLKKAGWLSQTDLEIRPREGCQDFCELVVYISELANWHCWVPVHQMSSKMVAECLWGWQKFHISLFFGGCKLWEDIPYNMQFLTALHDVTYYMTFHYSLLTASNKSKIGSIRLSFPLLNSLGARSPLCLDN